MKKRQKPIPKDVHAKVTLFKIETGVKPMGKNREMSYLTKQLISALELLDTPGQSFLIRKNQEPTVRKLLNSEKSLNNLVIKIGKTKEGDSFRRVFFMEFKKLRSDKTK